MPFLSVLRATAQHGLRVDTAHFEPREHADRESRRHVDVETAVAIQVRRIGAVLLDSFPVRQEHRHARAVFAVEEHLHGFITGRIERDFRRLEDRGAAGSEIVPEDGRRVEE